MRRCAALLAFAAAGCNSSDVAVTGGPFDPVQFFSGHTHGDATLRTITGASHSISVDSVGVPDGRGGLLLEQTIREDEKPPRTRRWKLQPSGPGRWTGPLTDAVGPTIVERTRVDVTIRYRMKNGATVEQHLAQPRGGAVDNHMAVSRFGVRVATLDERIRKVPA